MTPPAPKTRRGVSAAAVAPSSAWHALPPASVMSTLGSTPDGLTSTEASERLGRHGPNCLPSPPPRSAWVRFLRQFHNLLIYVLLAAAAVSGALGHLADTVVILAVAVLNALIGYVQEGRAEQALRGIRSLIAPHASVVRDGRRLSLDAEQLVPGDIVLLEPGDRVPADMRLLRARELRIDEALLTGESMAVSKAAEAVSTAAPLGERRGMTYSGTLVATGQGRAVVVATGAATEIGNIGRMLRGVVSLETPLTRQMNRFGKHLSLVILAVATLTFAFAVMARGYGATEAFMAMVGLTVAAIPEGLPAVLTITLALGVTRMASRHVIIRRLPAVEALGSVSVICSDKTGTLTRNEMMVGSAVADQRTYVVSGAGYEPRGGFRINGREMDPAEQPALRDLARAALLCNDASLRAEGGTWRVVGDPMEGALVSFAIKAGLDDSLVQRQWPRTDEIPFDAQHRFMASLHHGHDGDATAYVKGAPERLLEMCTHEQRNGVRAPLDRAWWQAQAEGLAARGQRVLAVARKDMSADVRDLAFSDLETGVVLVGLLGLLDPPRPEAIAAVTACRQAGIEVKMITGDHAMTAATIAAQLGLPHADRVVTGQALDDADADTFARLARDSAVFARTTPEHKLRLVTALQAQGAVVAMTGDGVNDAPALKRADVGVAMGLKGTEAAKEAAEMVLADDNFASIVAAVREGRTVYDNLKKVIAWTLPTNGGESLAIIGAIAFGITLPMTPLQILWVNMVTAVALGLTLAFEPTEEPTMRRPPRPADEPLLSRFLWWRILLVSLLFVAAVYGLFFHALGRGLPLEAARTVVVNTLVVLEIFYLFSVRYVHGSSLTWRGVMGTPAVLLGVGSVIVAQVLLTYVPFFQGVFQTVALGIYDSTLILATGVALLLVIEAEKRLRAWYLRPAPQSAR